MSGATNTEEIKKHTRIYITVFVALAALTLITVSVSRIEASVGVHIAIALLIAVIKGSLVASYFMHLINERKVIYSVLVLTVVFFTVLMFLPVFDQSNHGGMKIVP